MGVEPIRLDFGKGSDSGRYGGDAGPMHWNCYVEPVVEGKHPAPIYAHDGFVAFSAATGTSNPLRGMITLGQSIYALQGTTLSKISNSGARANIGGIAGTDKVVMARNAIASPQIAIVTEGGDRFVVQADTILPINDADLPPPNSVTYLNRKMIFGIPDGRFFWSSITDGTDISSLDFAEAEGNPDGGKRVIAHLQELWVMGDNSIEVWYDTGDGFARRGGTVIPKGCLGTHTVAQLDKDLFWVGDDGVVYVASGYGFQRISNHGVERSIRETVDKTNIVGWTYFRDGSSFYVLRGPDWTWQFNRTYMQWDRRFSYGSDRWLAEFAVQLGSEWIVGSNANDALYRLDASAFDEAGTTMVWRARTAPMHAHPKRISVDAIHLNFILGVGLNSTDAHDSDPTVGIRWSDDGGNSWSNQRTRPLGRLGVRKGPVSFYGLGTTGETGRIWELEVSSPVIRCLMYGEVEGDLIGI